MALKGVSKGKKAASSLQATVDAWMVVTSPPSTGEIYFSININFMNQFY